MSDLTPEEIEGIMSAINQDPPSKETLEKIPLRPPGSYGSIGKVAFSPLEGEKPRPLTELDEKEMGQFSELKATIEVVYGKTKLSLQELMALQEESLISLDDLCDDLVDIYANGTKIGRGEVVAVDGQFGVKIVTLDA